MNFSFAPHTNRFLLIRHGQTAANIDKRWHGSTDTPLTATGHQQASALSQRLADEDIDAIYCSPLQRARHTADAIAEKKNTRARIHEQLGEFCIGDWEGKRFEELLQEHQLFERIKADEHFTPPGGESWYQVRERMLNALADIHQKHQQQTIAIVSHAGVLAIALAELLENDPTKWTRFHMNNTAITELQMGSTCSLLSFNCDKHV